MDRRTAASFVASILLGGCGGGGSGGSSDASSAAAPAPAPAPAPGSDPAAAAPAAAPTPTVAAALSPNIAMWGDSLTPPVAANLQVLEPGRVVFDGGISGQTSTEIAARQLSDPERRNWITVFWYGANNPRDPARIEADLAASVAALAPGNDRFLVLPVFNEALPQSVRGGPVYASMMKANQDLAAQYPQNFFDMRSWLISQADPNSPQDLLDVQADVVPSSMRVDEIHFRNNGAVLVAQKLRELIAAKGW